MFAKIVLLVLVASVFEFGSTVDTKPWEPVAKNTEVWVRMHKSFVNQTKTRGKQIKLVFYGDSITQGWNGNGKAVWKKHYGNLSAVNYGIGGDKTQHLMYRIQHGEVDGLQPKVVVLKIGTNNIGSNTVPDIAKGVGAIVKLLHTKLPKVKVLLLAVLPRKSKMPEVKQLNSKIAALNNNTNVRFLDMSSKFEDAKGLKQGLYTDGVHLTATGYKVWAETMSPLLKKMME